MSAATSTTATEKRVAANTRARARPAFLPSSIWRT